jgi:hypothetical protein
LDFDGFDINIGDGKCHMENIFNNVTNGTAGLSLAKETFWAAQRQQEAYVARQQASRQHASNREPSLRRCPPPSPETNTCNQPTVSKEQADFEAAQFALKQAKLISCSVTSISGTIRKDQILLPDRSKSSQWTRLLWEIGFTHLTGPKFFFEPCNNLSFERIGLAVLLALVHPSLVSDLQELKTATAQAMYENIKTKFTTVSRAAQMNLWYHFMSFAIEPNGPSTGIASRLKDLYTKMKAVNVRMCSDVFLGFVLQLAIMASSGGFARDFKQRVELSIQQDSKSICPSFPTLLHIFDVCQQQHHQRSLIQQSQTPLPSNNSSLMMTAPDQPSDFDTNAYLADINEAEWTDALDFHAVTAHKCWHCGGENHYAR